jgi:hypothetical protein
MPNVDFSQFDHVHESEEAEVTAAKDGTIDTELKWD